jgi:hypothetical protein
LIDYQKQGFAFQRCDRFCYHRSKLGTMRAGSTEKRGLNLLNDVAAGQSKGPTEDWPPTVSNDFGNQSRMNKRRLASTGFS